MSLLTTSEMIASDEYWVARISHEPCGQCGKPAPPEGYVVMRCILATMRWPPMCSLECRLREFGVAI
jgi:hypothetical protein